MSKERNKKHSNITSTVSATETTGALQTPPQSEAERSELKELAGLEVPSAKRSK